MVIKTSAVGEQDDGCCCFARGIPRKSLHRTTACCRISSSSFDWRAQLLLLFASRNTATVGGQNDYSWRSCAAGAGAVRTAAVDSLVRSPRLDILFFSCAPCQAGVQYTPGLREPRTRKVVEGLGSGATQERENKTEKEIEQGLVAQERELGAVVESFATVLGEVSELSATVSQMRERLVQITDAINQHPQLAIGRARTRRRRIRRTLAAGGYFSCNETFTQGMETTWHQETLSGACVRELSDGGHLCCGNAKCTA